MINPFGRHLCRPCDRRHIVTQMAGDEMSLTQNTSSNPFMIVVQSELDRRHQSAFFKKRFCIHHVPPARAADKKIQPT